MTLPVVSISNKKKKKPSLVLTLSGAGLLIGGGIAAYWLLTQGKPLSRDLPVGANIIPQDALFTVSLSTDANQWDKLRSFGTKESQAVLDKNLIQLRDRFLEKEGFNFQKDVSPWVGDQVTVAILGEQQQKTASEPVPSEQKLAPVEQSMVMILPIKDQNKAQAAFTQSKALKGNWVDRQYEGMTIKEAEATSGEKLSTAVIEENYLIIADNPQATERTIKAYKSKATLANGVGFAKHFPQVATYQPLAQFYINIPSAAQIAATSEKSRLPAQVLAQLKNNQGLAGTIGLESQGLRFKGISWLKPNSQRVLAVENKATTMTSRLPESTFMMFSGGNLRRLWADYVLTAQKNPLSPVQPENLRSGFKNLSGLDLDSDLLSWMGGEFAISIIPDTPTKEVPQDVRVALVFMVQASDRQKAETSLKQLDDAMRTQYEFTIKEEKAGEIPVVRWIGPSGTLTATHGWLDKNVAFLALGTPITDKILPKPKNILANGNSFQKTVPKELNPVNGQFFLDMEAAAKSFAVPTLFPEQQSLLNAINSIGITSAVSDNRTTRYDILLKLKQGEKPQKLPISEQKN